MIRKFTPLAAVLTIFLFVAQPVLADAPPVQPSRRVIGITATVVTSDGVNLKLRSLPDGGAQVMELLPKDTKLDVVGLAVMDRVTVNVPVLATPTLQAVPVAIATAQAVANQVAPASGAPTGFLDTFDPTSCIVGGWAFDPARPTEAISVQISRDGAPGDPAAIPIGTFQTSLARPDVNAAKSTGGNHGFAIQFDAKSGMYDGQSHRIYVNALSASGAATPLNASGSPMTCTARRAPEPSGPTLDQVWLYVTHGLPPGLVHGWVNARYVQVSDKTGKQLSLRDALKLLPKTDPTTRGRAVGVVLPPLPDPSGGLVSDDVTKATTVYVANLDPGVNLSLRDAPDKNANRVALLPLGTPLSVCGRAGDAEGNLWLCVKAVTSSGTQQGYVLAQYVSTENQTMVLNAPAATPLPVQVTPDVTQAPPVQPAAVATVEATIGAPEASATPEATQEPPIVTVTP